MNEIIPFFHDLPAAAVPIAARLWDQAQSEAYNGQTAYQDFANDLRLLHIEPPPRAIAKRWVQGVQANLIARPGHRATGPEKPVATLPEHQPSQAKAKAERAARTADVFVEAADGGESVRPLIVADIDPETRRVSLGIAVPPLDPFTEADVQDFAARLVEATLGEIQRDARKHAAKLAASRLREMADRLEEGAEGDAPPSVSKANADLPATIHQEAVKQHRRAYR